MKLILSEKDRVVGVQGYAGTGKTRMLNRARALLEKKGYELKGLAPSASAAQTLVAEADIETETLQRFLVRNAGVAAGRLTKKGAKAMREAFRRTVLAAREANHPHLTTQKSFYVEISRARHQVELITDDRKALADHLEAVTGERVAALEGLDQAFDNSEQQERITEHKQPPVMEQGVALASGRGMETVTKRSAQELEL